MERIYDGILYERRGQVWLVKSCEDTNITDLRIPSQIDGHSVYCIGGGAFAGCYNLKSVKLPKTIGEIRHHAFANCSELQEVSIASDTVIVGGSAFVNCHKLHTVITASDITVGTDAFANCIALSHIDAKIDGLHRGGFDGCVSLKELHFAQNIYVFLIAGFIKSAVEKLYFAGNIPGVTEDLSEDRLYDIEWHCTKNSNITELMHLGFTVLVED